MLIELGVPFNEGISSEKNKNTTPRIVFWEYVWAPLSASSKSYNTVVTYQLSMYTEQPRDSKIIELMNILGGKGLKPLISHEYIENIRQFHSYLAIDIVEKL